MKRVFVIIALAATMVSLSSCVIEEGDSVKRKTEAARIIFDNVENNISSMIVLSDMAIKLSKWIDAPVNKKDSLEDLWFPEYKIRSDNGEWRLQNSSYFIKTDGNSLDSLNSQWSVGIGDDTFISVKCTAPKTWLIKCNGKILTEKYHLTDATLTIKGVSPLLSISSLLYDYNVSGEGKFLPDTYSEGYHGSNQTNKLEINYDINNEVRFINLRASEGEMDILVENLNGNSIYNDNLDAIHAEMIAYTDYGVVKYLTFMGYREVWTY